MRTLKQIEAAFPTEDSCRAYLVKMRWADGVRCPRCGSEKVHKLARPWNWQCKQCTKAGLSVLPARRHRFREHELPAPHVVPRRVSHVPVEEWNQRVADSPDDRLRFLPHRLVHVPSHPRCDDGRRRRAAVRRRLRLTRRSSAARPRTSTAIARFIPKTPVIGAISRKGKVVAKVIERVNHETVEAFMAETVSTKVDLVASDESTPTTGLHGAVSVTPRSITRAESTFAPTFTPPTSTRSGRC